MTRMKWKLKRKWPFSHQAQCLRKCWRKSRAAGLSFQSGKTLNSELAIMWTCGAEQNGTSCDGLLVENGFFSMSPFLVVSMLLLIRWTKKSPTYPCTGLSGWSWVSGLALLTLWCDKCQSFQATICYSCIRSQCSSSSLSFANFYDRERKNVKPSNTFSPTAPIGPTPPGGPCGPCNMSNSKCKFYRYQYVAPVQPICHTHISSTGTLRTSGTRRTRRTLRERKWY